jgi:RND family efflux transporter MFP subunit
MNSSSEAQDPRARLHVAELRRSEPTVADWRAFSEATSPEAYCQSWLTLQCLMIAGCGDAVVVLQKPGSQEFVPAAFWPPDDKRDRSHLAEVTERALREGRALVNSREVPSVLDPGRSQLRYQLAYPVKVEGSLRGVVTVEVDQRPESQLESVMRQLQWGAGWLEVMLRRGQFDPTEISRKRLAFVVELLSTFLEQNDFEAASAACVTELAAFLGCDRVSLGTLERRRVHMVALSHATQFDRHSNLARAIEAAMEEAIDQRETILYPEKEVDRRLVTQAHAALAQAFGSGAVLTVPLASRGRTVGALCLERAGNYRFEGPALELAQGVAALIGPLADMQRGYDRALPAHLVTRASVFWVNLAGPRHAGLKVTALLALAGIAYMCVASGTYRITSETNVEGSVQRVVAAPFQGFISEVKVRPGDTVKQGSLIAKLDDRDLRLERLKTLAQHEQSMKQYREAMANRDRAQIKILASQADQHEAQLQLIDEQLSRTVITAPFDGIVVSGDLSQSLGAPVERGQVLFEIAPLDSYRLVIQVDERDIADVAVGQHGQLTLSALPGQVTEFEVRKITPVNTAKEGRNFFRVEAAPLSHTDRIRPGMEGIGKIDVESRRLISIYTRDLVNWARLWLWTWWPGA